jgi:hypothetical protein
MRFNGAVQVIPAIGRIGPAVQGVAEEQGRRGAGAGGASAGAAL